MKLGWSRLLRPWQDPGRVPGRSQRGWRVGTGCTIGRSKQSQLPVALLGGTIFNVVYLLLAHPLAGLSFPTPHAGGSHGKKDRSSRPSRSLPVERLVVRGKASRGRGGEGVR